MRYAFTPCALRPQPGLPASVVGKVWKTTLTGLHLKAGTNGACSFVASTKFEETASSLYGAASTSWMRVDVDPANFSFAVEVGMFNKSTSAHAVTRRYASRYTWPLPLDKQPLL